MPLRVEELRELLRQPEADRVECTRSVTDKDKFREAICSFSNDMAGHGLPGFLLVGVDEKDPSFRLKATDDLLKQFVGYRSDGAILPLPMMTVYTLSHPEGGGDVIVVEAMKVLGYINHFGRGIARAGRVCRENGSAEPSFDYKTNHFLAVLPKHPHR